ncbi:NAD-binding protein [Streptomyces sp. NRRL B-24484]|uniref:NAD-binding protein n=1 Tax=Streptomyces sp. NRRL B-24484 TaxID=1463833 RepID=UPI000AB50604|nr:NAD-binding protein [Streptomyces sp. NRRL B-24484]
MSTTTGPVPALPSQTVPADGGTEPAGPPGPAGGPAAVERPAAAERPDEGGHMIVCGQDTLALRLAVELTTLYGRRVTVVVRSLREGQSPQIAALAEERRLPVRVVEAAEPSTAVLAEAGIREAAALALTGSDDQANVQAALRARRLNPGVRLVLRVYNRRLGRRVGQLLDRAAAARTPNGGPAPEASTTVLSTSATAAPALVSAAVSGHPAVVHVDGRLLRAAELPPDTPAAGTELATLALLPSGRGRSPVLLPGPGATPPPEGRRLVLELLGHPEERRPRRRLPGLSGLPVAALFSRRLRLALGSLTALLALFAGLTSALTGENPVHTAYLAVLDVIAIADPATADTPARKVLQILTALSGLLLMPLLTALALEALGTFRAASALRRPPRGISNHVVLLGLGRVGSRVLDRLRELDLPVVCVESDPTARGVARARAYGVPVVLGDATQEGVLEAARVGRARAMLALTSNDSTNLEAALSARECNPEVRVVMGLFDDDFAADVYRALRDSYPSAETRSHSVSFLSAPAFASAMMGRQVLGAFAVGRQVLLLAAVDVGGHPELAGRTVAAAHCPGHWQVLALDVAEPERRARDLGLAYRARPELRWNPPAEHELDAGDLVVVAATREGLGRLLRH